MLHKPRCSCPQCHVGSPQTSCRPEPKCIETLPRPALPRIGCTDDSDCPENLSCHDATGECRDPCTIAKNINCEPNKKCQVREHRPMCVCKHGFVVSDAGELTCAPDTSSCSRDFDCPSNAACIHSKCQNPCTATGIKKYSGKNGELQLAEKNNQGPCPSDKICDVLDHRPICICMKNCNPTLSICLRDSGCPAKLACRNYRCVDPCATANCPADSPCYIEEHKPVCKFCPPGFVPDSKYGCMKGKPSSMHGYSTIEKNSDIILYC